MKLSSILPMLGMMVVAMSGAFATNGGDSHSKMSDSKFCFPFSSNDLRESSGIFILKNPVVAFTATATPTGSPCFDSPSGSISVKATANAGNLSNLTNFTLAGVTFAGNNVAPISSNLSGLTTMKTKVFAGLYAGNYSVTVTDGANSTVISSIIVKHPPGLLALSAITVAPLCATGNTGKITLKGVFPAVGTYGDMSLVTSTTFTLTGQPAQAGTISGNTIQSTFSNLAAGSYGGTIFYNNCAVSTFLNNSITLTAPPAVAAVVTNFTPSACFGGPGSVSVQGSGGTGSYTFARRKLPSTTFVNVAGTSNPRVFGGLLAGTWEFRVTDANGCVALVQQIVTTPGQIQSSGMVVQNVTCFGGSDGKVKFRVTAGGTSPFTITLGSTSLTVATGVDATFTGLIAGSYTPTIKDANNCPATGLPTVNVTQPPVFTIDVDDINDPLCYDGSDGSIDMITTSGGFPPITYATGGQSDISGTVLPFAATIDGLPAGTYTISATDSKGCTATFSSVELEEPLELQIFGSVEDVSCFGGSDGIICVCASGGTPICDGGCSYQAQLFQGNVLIQDFSNVFECIGEPDLDINLRGGSCTFSGLSAGTYTVVLYDANECSTTKTITIDQPTAVAITNVVAVDETCDYLNNGSLSGTIGGGTPNYSITFSGPSFNTTVTGYAAGNFSSGNTLAAGTYNFTVTDANGCTATGSKVVGQPATLTASLASTTPVSCFGGSNGSVILNVSGGTSPYILTSAPAPMGSVQVNNSVTGLTAGSYSVSVTDSHGCTTSAVSATVTQPTVVSVSSTASFNPNCAGSVDGSITFDFSGGISPYSVRLKKNSVSIVFNTNQAAGSYIFDNLSAATYELIVTDANGCSKSAFKALSDPPTLVVSVASTTNIDCHGASTGAVTINVSGGTPGYTFFWSNGQTSEDIFGLSAGTYSVTVTDTKNCTKTFSATLTQSPILSASVVSVTNVTCFDDDDGTISLSISGGVSPYSVSLVGDDGTFAKTNVSSTVLVDLLPADIYEITVTDALGCTFVLPSDVTITQPDELDGEMSGIEPSCFGTSDGSLTISATGGTTPYSYHLETIGLDAQGVAVDITQNDPLFEFLTNGEYAYTITDAHDCEFTGLFTSDVPTQVIAYEEFTYHYDNYCFGDSSGQVEIYAEGGAGLYNFYLYNAADELLDSLINEEYADFSGLKSGVYHVVVNDITGCQSGDIEVVITEPEPIIINIEATQNLLCAGAENGSITISLTIPSSNNIPPFWYELYLHAGAGLVFVDYPTFTPEGFAIWEDLAAGDYQISVTDDDSYGCSYVKEVNLTEPDILDVSVELVSLSCFEAGDGSICGEISGGTAPFTATLSNIGLEFESIQNLEGAEFCFSDLQSGEYTLLVTDANGCIFSQAYMITQPADITFTTQVLDATCSGSDNGSITVYASECITAICLYEDNEIIDVNCVPLELGCSTFVFENLPPGLYYFAMNNEAGCEVTNGETPLIISEPDPISIDLDEEASNSVSCFGGENGELAGSISGGTSPYDVHLTGPNGYDESVSSVESGDFVTTGEDLEAGTYLAEITDDNGCTYSESFVVTQPEAPLSGTLTMISLSCAGSSDGQVLVETTGGTPLYSYEISPGEVSFDPGFENLAAGFYEVTISDANDCTAVTDLIEVTEPEMLDANASSPTVSCQGGEVSINPVGGTSPYTMFQVDCDGYSPTIGDTIVSDGSHVFTDLGAGTFCFLVYDANGCGPSQVTGVISEAQITEFQLEVFAEVTDNLCYGDEDGALDITASGGSGDGYTYNWGFTTNEDLTNLEAGNYSVTVTDVTIGCTVVGDFTVGEPDYLSLDLDGPDVSCAGGTSNIDFQFCGGTAPYTVNILIYDEDEEEYVDAGIDAQTFAEQSICDFGASFSDLGDCEDLRSGDCFLIDYGNVLVMFSSTQFDDSPPPGSATYGVTVPADKTGLTFDWDYGSEGSTEAEFGYSVNGSGFVAIDISAANNGVVTITGLEAGDCVGFMVTTISQSEVDEDYAVIGFSNLRFIPNTVIPPTAGSFENLPAGDYLIVVQDANGCSNPHSWFISEPDPIVLSETHQNIACFGGDNGEIQIDATGGSGDLSFGINQNASIDADGVAEDLSAGTYIVTVTDENDCTATISVVITEPTELVLTETHVPAACAGGDDGAIDLTVAGGTSDYTYLWSNGAATQDISNLEAGDYSVTVTDENGCTKDIEIGIEEPALLSVLEDESLHKNAVCHGQNSGGFTVYAFGGDGDYDFQCNNNVVFTYNNDGDAIASNLAAGTYLVTVTDGNGCTDLETIVITQPNPIVVSATFNPIACNGGATSVTISATGGSGTYSSGTGVFSQNSGNYTAIVTDNNGCTGTLSYTIAPAAPIAIATTITNVGCFGGNTGAIALTVSGGMPNSTAPFYAYLWSNGATSKNLINLIAGSYLVTVTDSKGCTATASASVAQPAAVLASAVLDTDVTCFGQNDGTITLTTTGGTTPYSFDWSNIAGPLNPQNQQNLAPGNYFVTITDANACTVAYSVNITQPDALQPSAATVNPTCFGGQNGSIDVSATGGVTAYQYSINGGQTFLSNANFQNLSAGNYTVVVKDANACTASVLVTLTAPAQVVATATSTPATCNGSADGSIFASGSGGSGGYSFSKNGGTNYQSTGSFSGLLAGNYTIVVRDAAGCTGSISISVSQPTVVSATVSVNPIGCFGGNDGQITVTASGGTPTYLYSNNGGGSFQTSATFSGLPLGNYAVVVRDANSCTFQTSATVTQPTALVLTETHVNSGCGNATGSIDLSVSGGTSQGSGCAGYSYLWSNGATTQDLSALSAGNFTVTVTDCRGCTKTLTVNITGGSQIVLTELHQNVVCHGGTNGSINLSVSGGQPAYIFNWSNGATFEDLGNLAAGIYTVTVTDGNGCTKVLSTTITQPAMLALTETHINVACFDGNSGSIDLSATGGTGSLTYLWSNGATSQDLSGLVAGNYSVTTTDANGCTKSISVNISQPTMLNLTETHVNISCAGGQTGSIDLSVSGGTSQGSGCAGYSYLWSNGATTQDLTNVPAGTYSVTVTDCNGCKKSISVTILQAPTLVANTSFTPILCNGGSGTLTLSATGGNPPYTGTGDFVRTAGTYTFTVTDASGCTASKTVTISQPPVITTIISQQNVSCNGGSNGTIGVIAQGGSGGFTFQLNSGPFTSNASFQNLAAGTYSITVRDVNGCTKSNTATIIQPSAIVVSAQVGSIACSGGSTSVIITASGGTSPYTGTGTFTRAAGSYNFTVTDNKGCTSSQTVIVTEPAPIVITTTISGNSCGSTTACLTISPSGGTPGYQMQLSGQGTGSQGAISQSGGSIQVCQLPFGTYSVTITDANGCSTTKLVEITAGGGNIVVTSQATNVLCAGGQSGTITVSASGGVPAYQYKIGNGAFQNSPLFSNLAAANYVLTVKDASGCTGVAQAIVQQPAAFTVATTQINPTCGGQNGSISASATGGTPAYSYQLNGGSFQNSGAFTNLSAGNYTVIAKDANGCTSSATVALTSTGGGPISIVIDQTLPVSCPNGTNGAILATVTGCGPFTFKWYKGNNLVGSTEDLLNITAGVYSLFVVDGSGSTGQLLNITVGSNTQGIENLVAEDIAMCLVKLKWTAKLNVDGYEVRFKPCASSTWTTASAGTNTSYTFTGLSASTCYNFEVRFVSEECFGEWTGVGAVTTPNLNPPISVSHSVNSNSSATINWAQAACGGAAQNGVEIRYRKTGTASWTVVTLSASTVSHTINGLMPGACYQYRLRNRYAGNVWSSFTTTRQFCLPLNLSGGGQTESGLSLISIQNNVPLVEIYTEVSAEIVAPVLDFTAFPNPATDVLNVRFESVDEANPLIINVLNIAGQRMATRNLLDATNLRDEQIEVARLPQGLYFLEVQNGDLRKVVKFVKQ